MPQLRQNIITGDWVIIAPERSKRPNEYNQTSKQYFEPLNVKKDCVFCQTGPEYRRRLRQFDNKHTWVIPNKFPAFLADEAEISTRSYYPEHSFFRAKAAVGEHEIVVIREHDTNLFNFSQAIWSDLLASIQARMLVHRRNPQVEQMMPIYNHQSQAGASIVHPHAQIFSAPVIPNMIELELEGAKRYYTNNGYCIFCDLVTHEHRERLRIVEQSENFIAFTFYASRFPFEIWILPKNHQSNFEALITSQRKELAQICQAVVQKVDRLLQNPPLNWWIHSLPTLSDNSEYYHWHLEIAPRVAGYGGYELGSNMVIDIQSPEEAARYLNKQ